MSPPENNDGFRVRVDTAPMLDTGIAQEMGYANDKEFLEAREAGLAGLSPETRDAIKGAMAEIQRRLLLG